MAYIKTDDSNRITAFSNKCHCGADEIVVEIPSFVNTEKIHDYVYANGKFKYEPRPVVTPTTDEIYY